MTKFCRRSTFPRLTWLRSKKKRSKSYPHRLHPLCRNHRYRTGQCAGCGLHVAGGSGCRHLSDHDSRGSTDLWPASSSWTKPGSIWSTRARPSANHRPRRAETGPGADENAVCLRHGRHVHGGRRHFAARPATSARHHAPCGTRRASHASHWRRTGLAHAVADQCDRRCSGWCADTDRG